MVQENLENYRRKRDKSTQPKYVALQGFDQSFFHLKILPRFLRLPFLQFQQMKVSFFYNDHTLKRCLRKLIRFLN